MEVKDASVEALLRGAVVDGQHVAELKEMDNIPCHVIIVKLMNLNLILTFASIASGFIAILEERDADLGWSERPVVMCVRLVRWVVLRGLKLALPSSKQYL